MKIRHLVLAAFLLLAPTGTALATDPGINDRGYYNGQHYYEIYWITYYNDEYFLSQQGCTVTYNDYQYQTNVAVSPGTTCYVSYNYTNDFINFETRWLRFVY
jgi:hypothetical protein